MAKKHHNMDAWFLQLKKAKKGKEEEKVDSPSPPEDGKKGLLDEI